MNKKIVVDVAVNTLKTRSLTLPLVAALFVCLPVEGASLTGEQLIQRACLQCHDTNQFAQLNFERTDWEMAVKMMAAGKALTDADMATAVDYLASNFKGKRPTGVAISGPVQVSIHDWSIPAENTLPQAVFFTNRGALAWYTGEFSNVLGRFDAKGQKFEEVHLRPESDPYALVEHAGSGVQGTIYFTSRTGGFIGEFDPNKHEVREFRIPGPKILLHNIAFDPNGVVWFTALAARPPRYPQGSKIGSVNIFSSEIKMAGTLTRNGGVDALAVSSKGIPFFSESESPRLGSVHPATMKVIEYSLPSPASRARGLAFTADDMLWYTDGPRGYLGRFDAKTGKFSEWLSPSGPTSRPYGIASVGGVVWYAETGTSPNMLVRFDPTTEKFQSWPLHANGEIKQIYAQPGGSLWLVEPMANRIVNVAPRE